MRWMMSVGTWFKSHLLVSILIGVLAVGGTVSGVVVLNNVFNKTSIELKEKLDFEINSDVYLVSLINKISNGEILTDNYKIDTSKLGKQELTIKYLNQWKKKEEYKFSINIVDTTSPTIEFKKDLSTTIGTKIDLLKGVVVKDNSKEEIKATIDGKCDFNKAGTYKLKYVAVDSSNNKVEEEFTLNVKDIALKKSGYYVYKSKEYWAEISFSKGNGFEYSVWHCPGQACGGDVRSGTYKKDGNKVTLNVKEDSGYDGMSYSPAETWKVTLVNDRKLTLKGNTYTWQSEDMSYE